MTRETKIGLLVGLAFIIVIGILLSDHLTSSTEPPPATLAQAGTNVRQQVITPGGAQPPAQPVVAPQQVQPQQPVATQRDLVPQTPATAIVQVGGPAQVGPAHVGAQPAPITTQTPADAPPITIVTNDPHQLAPQTPQYTQPAVPPQDIQVAGADMPDSAIARLAQQHGEQVVAVGGTQQVVQTQTPTGTPQLAGYKEYTAQPGDSVSRMASRFLGANTKANRDAILRANPSLQNDPNKVIEGRTYRIPSAASAPAAPVQVVQTPAAAPAAQSTGIEYWYTVREGDSLWRIASEQLGKGGSGVAAIKELNKDVLNGSDTVHPNMRLRLPGKPVAQAN